MTKGKFEIRPISSALGAEIHGLDLAADLDEDTIERIRSAFLRYAVLVIRDQRLLPEHQIAFAELFGQLDDYPYAGNAIANTALTEIVKLPEETFNFGSGWHMDMSFRQRTPLATVLYAKEVPAVGGDTLYASLTMAYRTLSKTMKELLEGVIVVHEAWPGDAARHNAMALSFPSDEGRERARHPLVSIHPDTGEAFLFVSPFYAREIQGMTPDESLALLDFLNTHATRPEHTCRVRWEPNTLTIWDNRCTIHNALDDDFGAILDGRGFKRVMHRAVVCTPTTTAQTRTPRPATTVA